MSNFIPRLKVERESQMIDRRRARMLRDAEALIHKLKTSGPAYQMTPAEFKLFQRISK